MKYYNLDNIDIESDDFKQWNRKAEALKRQLEQCATVEERKRILKQNKHWKDAKEILIKTFGKLCWYSDCGLEGAFVDVDHYRPKNRSLDLEEKTILEDGYWWLAYDYKNFRLSCEVVNRRYNEAGKVDFFPLKDCTDVATHNGLEDLEKPLLLDPCNEEDTKLIGYREGGEIVSESDDLWDSERVEKSAKIYNLNEFSDGRNRAIQNCKSLLESYKLCHTIADCNDEVLKKIAKNFESILDPKTPYSSVAFNFLMFQSFQPEYKEIHQELQEIIISIYKGE